MEIRELFKQALERWQDLVATVRTEQWAVPTPDAEWNVRRLVNHVVGELLWMKPLIEGKTIAEVGNVFDGDLLGESPLAASQQAVTSARDTVSTEGALDRIVQLSMGPTPASEYCAQIASDVAVHSWDLAQAIGIKFDIDPRLIDLVMQTFGPMVEGARKAGVFGPAFDVAENSDAETKMLAMTGRSNKAV